MLITKKYLNFPVKKSGKKIENVKIQIKDAAGQIVRYFNFIPATENHDFMAFYNMSEFSGQELEICVASGDCPADYFSKIEESDQPLGLENLYDEKYRSQIRFSSRRGWLNDPNGMVYYNGKWHLFYQHNPFGTEWGNMHWGHTTSPNLVNWTEEDDVLYPDSAGSMFSGGAVVDWDNTSGLQDGAEPPIFLFYTAAGGEAPVECKYTQWAACSTDGGKTFKKQQEILPHISDNNRDPKVIWHEPSKSWVMVLYLDFEREGTARPNHRFAFLRSNNLLEWKITDICYLTGCGECPEFFELAVDGDPDNKKWVLIDADGVYKIGSFDGYTFTPESDELAAYILDSHEGRIYASQCWSNAPDKRQLLIGWIRGTIPNQQFNQSMSFPTELSLKTIDQQIKLCLAPARELSELFTNEIHTLENIQLPQINLLQDIKNSNLYVEVDITFEAKGSLEINGRIFNFDPQKNELEFEDTTIKFKDNRFVFETLIDCNAVELFANQGSSYAAQRSIEGKLDIKLSGQKGEINKITIIALKSIWNNNEK